MGALLQLCLGSVYAWSYFQQPLVDAYGWSHTRVAWTFSLAIAFLGLSAAAGGLLLPRFGPRNLALTGSLLYGAGYLIAGLALHFKLLWLLWLGFGVVGGVGLGLGYVTPVATVAKWFPDKKGLVTGMVVMGFGFGALLMSKLIAPALGRLFAGQLPMVLAGTGVVLALVGSFAALFLRNPPDAPVPPGVEPIRADGETRRGRTADSSGSPFPRLCSRAFVTMWLMFFCNIAAGIALIGFQSPLFQDLRRRSDPALPIAVLAAGGASLIAVSSIFNGLGRLLWGAVSDRIGQLGAFRLLLGTQVLAFVGLMLARDPRVFAVLVCYVLLGYGGGFGVMPSFVLNTFGAERMAVLYGCMLTAWSAAGVIGPQVVARLKDQYGGQAVGYAFACGTALLAAGFVLSITTSDAGRRGGEPGGAKL